MSLLSYHELCELVEQNVITNVKHEQINGASIDITVGGKFLTEFPTNYGFPTVRSWGARESVPMCEYFGTIELEPGQFCLAESQQVFNLPNDIACEYVLKSSMARSGIQHFTAGWCDPGWNGSVLTLELINHLRWNSWLIREGDPIGQMKFFRVAPVPMDRSYASRGRYNNDATVTGIKA